MKSGSGIRVSSNPPSLWINADPAQPGSESEIDICRPAALWRRWFAVLPLADWPVPLFPGLRLRGSHSLGAMVDQPVDGGHGGGFVREHLVPFAEELVCGDQERAPLVARRDQLEQDAGLGLVLPDIGEVVEDQEMVAVEPGEQALQGEFGAVPPGGAGRDRWCG